MTIQRKRIFTEDYDPGKFEYKLNKDGRIMFDEEGNPIPIDKGIIEKGLEMIPPMIKEGADFITDPFNVKLYHHNLHQLCKIRRQ